MVRVGGSTILFTTLSTTTSSTYAVVLVREQKNTIVTMIPIMALVLFVRVRGILAPCARVWGPIPVRDQERGV